jgi:Zn-dependent peptidase ImmA (M78 family)
MPADPVARSMARALVDRLGIATPGEIDIELIANLHGLIVERRGLTQEEGRLIRHGDVGLIVVSDAAYNSKKWRFVIAHELGHYIRHPRLNQLDLCTNAHLAAGYWGSGHEAEANTFAVELLMPEKLFRKRTERDRPSLRYVAELATTFDTSLTSTAIRFVELTPEPCAVVISRRGEVSHVSWSADFRLGIKRGTRLTDRTYAGDLFAGKRVLDQLQQVDGDAWSSSRGADALDVFEHSVMTSPTTVLSLLWHRYPG